MCSLHEKECPCRLCSIAHVTLTWGCALQVTVSTSNSCCCPLQLFRVVAHWVAMRSWSLVHLNTSLERSVELPLASMCSLDKEKVFPRIDNAEITDFNFKRNSTLTCSAICRSLALGLVPSGHDGLLVQTLISFSCGCQQFRLSPRKGSRLTLLVSCPSGACLNRSLLRAMSRQVPCCHCSAVSLERRAAISIRCRCLTRLVFASVITSSFGNTKGKLFMKVTANISSTFCMLQGSTDSVCGFSTSSALVSHIHFRPNGGPRVNIDSISECSAGKRVRPISCEQTTYRQCYFIDKDNN